MHEYSLIRALLDRVEAEVDRHAATEVHRIEVQIGEMAGVEIELLRSAYELCRDSGPCRRAELDVTRVPARWACRDCRVTIPPGEILRCPSCRQPARMVSGDEIVLQRIEMEVA